MLLLCCLMQMLPDVLLSLFHATLQADCVLPSQTHPHQELSEPFCHTDLSWSSFFLSSPPPFPHLVNKRGSKVLHSCCLFCFWVMQVSTLLKSVQRLSRAGRVQSIMLEVINSCYRPVLWSTGSWLQLLLLTMRHQESCLYLFPFPVFRFSNRTKNFLPRFQNRWDSAVNTAVRKPNTIKWSITFHFARRISDLWILLPAVFQWLKVWHHTQQAFREHSSFLKFSM